MFRKILFLIFFFQFGFSQERQLIKGKVIYRNIDVPSANVVNNTSQNTTITNENGEFDQTIFSKSRNYKNFKSVTVLNKDLLLKLLKKDSF